MLSLIKEVFIVLLSFSSSLAHEQTKCLFLNDELCMVKHILFNIDSVEVKYCPFMISLNKLCWML